MLSEPDNLSVGVLVRPAILLLLREQESHGYEVMRRLHALGVAVPPDAANVYRLLRTMDDDGLAESYWTTPAVGPARRMYILTPVGEQHLEHSMMGLSGLLDTVNDMLIRYHGDDTRRRARGA